MFPEHTFSVSYAGHKTSPHFSLLPPSHSLNQSNPHNDHELSKPLRSKKKRSAVFIVIIASIAVHVLALGGLAAIKIIEVLQPEPEFEAPPIVEVKPRPPPPPPPPTSKRAQRSLPRPQPLTARNPQNMSVPAIEISNSNLSIGGGRGFGGGLGDLGGAVAESLRITSFGYDRAMEGTLHGTLYDLKQDRNRKSLNVTDKLGHATRIFRAFTNNFNISPIERKFFKSEKELYASYFVIPMQQAAAAPAAFGAQGEIAPSLLAVYYEGTYKPRKSGRFRLFGQGDDVLAVRIKGKLVLDATRGYYSKWKQNSAAKRANQANPEAFLGLGNPGVTGHWFTLREGAETEVEILFGEIPGGLFGGYILIEEEGVPGRKIFSTRPLSAQDKNFLRKLHPDAAQFID